MWIPLLASKLALAEPCFMVMEPPTQGVAQTLVRQGVQRTWISWIDGVQDVVVQPSFVGTTSEFGVVIPFPSAPVLRKVEPGTLEQVALAIEPPVMAAAPEVDSLEAEVESVATNEVRVLKREVVGMYEAVTLEAGSDTALLDWLGSNGFVAPPGLTEVAGEYVAEGWLFVAVRVALTGADGTVPQPGQTDVRLSAPEGQITGPMQAMGFRFRHPALVLSAKMASLADRSQMTSEIFVLTHHPGHFDRLGPGLVERVVPGPVLRQNLDSIAGLVPHARGLVIGDLATAASRGLEEPPWGNEEQAWLAQLDDLHLTVVSGQFDAAALRGDHLRFVSTGPARPPSPPTPDAPPAEDMPRVADPGGCMGAAALLGLLPLPLWRRRDQHSAGEDNPPQ